MERPGERAIPGAMDDQYSAVAVECFHQYHHLSDWPVLVLRQRLPNRRLWHHALLPGAAAALGTTKDEFSRSLPAFALPQFTTVFSFHKRRRLHTAGSQPGS